MAWVELSIDTTQEAVDWVSTQLAATNYTGDIHITQYTPEFAPSTASPTDPAPEPSPWAFTLRLYLPQNGQTNACIDAIARQLSPLHRTGLTTALQLAIIAEKPTPTEIRSSPAHRIGKRFVVLAPDTASPTQPQDIPLRLPPSLAFGSGLHPATILSLQLLEQHVLPTMAVLDLGCGSGILTVAMAKLGAQVLAIDNDVVAVQATQEAVRLNQVESQVEVMAGSLGSGSELGHWMGLTPIAPVPAIAANARFDLIAANILARVHITLAADFQQALRRSPQAGLLISAGFTTDYADEVDAALTAAGLTAIARQQMQEWVAFVHRLD